MKYSQESAPEGSPAEQPDQKPRVCLSNQSSQPSLINLCLLMPY